MDRADQDQLRGLLASMGYQDLQALRTMMVRIVVSRDLNAQAEVAEEIVTAINTLMQDH